MSEPINDSALSPEERLRRVADIWVNGAIRLVAFEATHKIDKDKNEYEDSIETAEKAGAQDMAA